MFFFNWNDPQKKNVADEPVAPANQVTQVTQVTQDTQVQPVAQPMAQSEPQEPQELQESQTPYVDAYTPPDHLKHTPWTDQTIQSTEPVLENQPMAASADQVADSDSEPMPSTPMPSTYQENRMQEQPEETLEENSENFQFADNDQDLESKDSNEFSDESLEAQNIFTLLGVEDGEESEKEAFLDELQQVVWEDFVENDSKILLTEADYSEFSKIIENADISNEQVQEQALTFLEKVLPNLEEIMLDKAIELKREMVMERVAGMKEYYAGKEQSLEVISRAEDQFRQDQWATGAQTLNSLN